MPPSRLRDYVRCRGCQKLTMRVNADIIEGSWYGPECLAKVRTQPEIAEVNTDQED